jgi:hypothetical protein
MACPVPTPPPYLTPLSFPLLFPLPLPLLSSFSAFIGNELVNGVGLEIDSFRILSFPFPIIIFPNELALPLLLCPVFKPLVFLLALPLLACPEVPPLILILAAKSAGG